MTADRETLCWGCIHAVPDPDAGHGCSWSKNRKMVPGAAWEEKQIYEALKFYRDRGITTRTVHIITVCPQFAPRPPRKRPESTDAADGGLAENLLRYRERAGMTRKEAARMLGVSARSFGRWEEGKARPHATRLPNIAALYDCTVEDLTTGKGGTKR